jgi:hypothetical protein
MTAMVLELPTSVSAAGSQAAHAVALAGLLRRTDLPVLVWTVYPSGLVGRAFGDTDLMTTLIVAKWARGFNTVSVTECAPSLVPMRYQRGSGWRLEPGRATARLSADVSVFGELVELPGGVR